MSTEIDVVEGKVLDSSQFTNLYRLLDLERSAVEEAQRLSMSAAFEILDAYEGDQWHSEKRAEWDAYAADHGYQPPWSPASERTFVKWLQERAERDGHPFQGRGTIMQLKNAAECYRLVKSNKVVAAATTLPETERAWRPAAKLLKLGFRQQVGAVVEKAAEIAEEEGKPVTYGIMSAARSEIWKTDPQIRQWVEQPGQTVDPRSAHDRVVTALNHIRKEANDLRRLVGDNKKAWNEFLAGLAEIQ